MNISNKLRKRTRYTLLISATLALAAAVIGGGFFFIFLSGGTKQFLTNAVYSLAVAAEMLLLFLILLEIRKKGKPFTGGIILKLRLMAAILIGVGCTPSYMELDIAPDTKLVTSTFDFQNFLIIGIGVIMLIVAQIFVYGRQLQEDNDLIA